jgi:uncharacterized protein (DUF1501 family)
LNGTQRALAVRPSSHYAGRCSAADPSADFRPVVGAFFRGTLAPKRETSLAFAAVSAQVSRPRIATWRLCCELQLSNATSENTKRREVAAHECFRLAGPTGLEPATSGVTGRRSNQLNYDPAS